MSKGKQFWIYLSLLFFTIGVIGVKWKITHAHYFKVREVEWIGERINLGMKLKGENIFQVKGEEIVERISSHPQVKEVRVSKILPSKLRIEVKKREAVIFWRKGRRILGIDEEGVFFPVKSSKFSPLLVGWDKPVVEGRAYPEAGRGARAYLSLKEKIPHLKIDRIRVQGNNVFLYTYPFNIEIRMVEDNFQKQAERLNKIWGKWKKRPAQYIDLRFGEEIPVK